jgi:hypothetical protein
MKDLNVYIEESLKDKLLDVKNKITTGSRQLFKKISDKIKNYIKNNKEFDIEYNFRTNDPDALYLIGAKNYKEYSDDINKVMMYVELNYVDGEPEDKKYTVFGYEYGSGKRQTDIIIRDNDTNVICAVTWLDDINKPLTFYIRKDTPEYNRLNKMANSVDAYASTYLYDWIDQIKSLCDELDAKIN